MSEDQYDPNALWVALNDYSEGHLFHVYPKLLSELLVLEDAARVEGDTSEAEKLVLPSDKEWRLQQYFHLVSLQKQLASESDEPGESDQIAKPPDQAPEEWAPWSFVLPVKNPNAPPPVAVRTSPGPAWDIKQVLMAARLLCKPPMRVDFSDEQEMRTVYSVIYDVFRYKTIVDQSLNDVQFFSIYPQYKTIRQITWLFVMELARRRWAARQRPEVDRAMQLLEGAGSPFKDVESAVWEQRVHFAAAIARIRIKNKAFSLSDLLPMHLRDERVSACINKDTVTGWVNTFKADKVATLVRKLHDLGYTYSNSRQLCAGEYRFDRVCPRFLTLRPPPNRSIGQLDLVKDGIVVLQEREFCEGASTLCRALRANSLQGVVAQTHASSPRCSAYLAAQLRELAAVLKAQTPAAPATPELGRLVVFGAGDKVDSYVCALRELGIEASEAPQSGAPVCVLSDPVHFDTPTVISALDGVVAALATPPNSYSAVTDPIDLVCGRGGDLAMLEILTETEVDLEGKRRVQNILEEQKKTLKTLLSKPQIQLIMYETHSALEAENQAQVTRAVAEANRLARERHTIIKRKHREYPSTPKLKDLPENTIEVCSSVESCSTVAKDSMIDELADHPLKSMDAMSDSNGSDSRPSSAGKVLKKRSGSADKRSRPGTTKSRPIPDQNQAQDMVPRDPDMDNPDVLVPNCDLFEITNLPNLGNGLDINYILDRDGCFLGLIQRKEITRLDAKYMIRVAEERGLFGPTVSQQPARRRRTEPASAAPRRRRRKTSGFEVERVAAPTYASLVRSTIRRGSAPACLSLPFDPSPPHVCERHARRQAAATALTAAACTCDARHRLQPRKTRRASVDVPRPTESRNHSPICRRPFPLVVTDLQLRTNIQPHKFLV